MWIAGKVDKITEMDNAAPLTLLFIAGPFGFVVAFAALCIVYEPNNKISSKNPLHKVYELGLK